MTAVSPLPRKKAASTVQAVAKALQIICVSPKPSQNVLRGRAANNLVHAICFFCPIILAQALSLLSLATRTVLFMSPLTDLLLGVQLAGIWRDDRLFSVVVDCVRSLDKPEAAASYFTRLRKLIIALAPGTIVIFMLPPVAANVPHAAALLIPSFFNGITQCFIQYFCLLFFAITRTVRLQLRELRAHVQAGTIDEVQLLHRFRTARQLMLYTNRAIGPVIAAITALFTLGGAALAYDIAVGNYVGLFEAVTAVLMILFFFVVMLIVYCGVTVSRAHSLLLQTIMHHYSDHLLVSALQRNGYSAHTAGARQSVALLDIDGKEEEEGGHAEATVDEEAGCTLSHAAIAQSVQSSAVLCMAAPTFQLLQHAKVEAQLLGWSLTPAMFSRLVSVLVSVAFFALRSFVLAA